MYQGEARSSTERLINDHESCADWITPGTEERPPRPGCSVRDILRLVDRQRLYLCSKRGSTFVIYGDSGERYTVVVGPQTCSCSRSDSQAFEACVHLLFVMLKVLQVRDANHDLLVQPLSCLQVEQLFRGFNRRRKRLIQAKTSCPVGDKVQRSKGSSGRRDINLVQNLKKYNEEESVDPLQSVEDITCSICLQELRLSQSLMGCPHCSNQFHRRCITIWQKECVDQLEALTCPLCRRKWPHERPTLDWGGVSDDLWTSRDSKPHTCPRPGLTESDTNPSINKPHLDPSENTDPRSYTRRPSDDKVLGYCFPLKVNTLLTSSTPLKREEGLRLVVANTIQTVLSAGSTLLTRGERNDQPTNDTEGCLSSSMRGYTTGVMLKEAFRVIASLLDDVNYRIFMGSLRSFRDILGFVACADEGDVERIARMISPVLYSLLRICGELSHKKKSQMSLSVLFELSNGQDGDMALGRELTTGSMPATGWHKMTRFVLRADPRFTAKHSYGRLAILEKMVERFDLGVETLRKVAKFVVSQIILVNRCSLLNRSESREGEAEEVVPEQTGMSCADKLVFSSHRMHKLAKAVFISTTTAMVPRLQFLNWSIEDIRSEVRGYLDQLSMEMQERLLTKLTFLQVDSPKEQCGEIEAEVPRVETSNVTKGPRLSTTATGGRETMGKSVSSVKVLKMATRTPVRGSIQLSPFIKITPEPAYDSVAESESDYNATEGQRLLYSEMAIHNSLYELGLLSPGPDPRDGSVKAKVSGARLRSVIASMECQMAEEELESQAPPGLGIFSSEYRAGYEWCKGRLLGTGAFSKCYQGRDVATGLLMAVKQISVNHYCVDKNEEVIKAVRTEVNLMVHLRHPNVLPLLGAGFSPLDNNISVFVRWMPGGSIASLLSQYGPFLEPATLAYSVQTSRGLSYIHSHGILHRDLKGANLLLDGSGMRLRISDFGASARLSNGRDSNAGQFKGQVLGTVAFMAPEVLRGQEYGRACDVWSFGCCVIEMLTASQPWRDQNHTNHIALMYSIASSVDPPRLPDQISEDLSHLLLDCFSREPKSRPRSCQLEKYKVFRDFLEQ